MSMCLIFKLLQVEGSAVKIEVNTFTFQGDNQRYVAMAKITNKLLYINLQSDMPHAEKDALVK